MPKAKVNGINLYYEVHGQGDPLVMIMGFGGSSGGLIFQRRAFQKYFQVITFDNRGWESQISQADRTPSG